MGNHAFEIRNLKFEGDDVTLALQQDPSLTYYEVSPEPFYRVKKTGR